jgi:hypothetical protein
MLIKMLKTTKGSSDGRNVYEYKSGEQYNVSEGLADSFVNVMGVAELVDNKKSVSVAPKNKAMEVPKDKVKEEVRFLDESLVKEKEEKKPKRKRAPGKRREY